MTKLKTKVPTFPEKFKIREEWLEAAVKLIAPRITDAGNQNKECKFPERVRVSVGFPSRRGLSLVNRCIGESWAGKASGDKVGQVFISPTLEDAVRVLEVLEHELCHQSLPHKTGHKGPFARLMKALGHEGKPTHTVPGEAFKKWAVEHALPALGGYPHSELKPLMMVKPKKCPLVICTCENEKCEVHGTAHGYKARITRPTLRKYGAPDCPSCGKQLDDPEGLYDPEGGVEEGEG